MAEYALSQLRKAAITLLTKAEDAESRGASTIDIDSFVNDPGQEAGLLRDAVAAEPAPEPTAPAPAQPAAEPPAEPTEGAR
jgi:hypothetical protein